MANSSIGETVEEVQSLYSKGAKSKDSRLSSRHIYSVLLKNRSTVLKQQANKNQTISDWSYQQLPCIELIQVELPHTDKILLRTKYKLPTPISGLDDMLINSVTTIDGSIRFDRTTFEGIKYDKGKKFTPNKPSFYIKNQYGFINYKTKLQAITMYGLFDDPIQASRFPSLCGNCKDCDCIDIMELEFPVDKDTKNTIVKLAVNELIILFSQMKEDKNNNSTDDNQSGNQMIHQPQDQ